jgi:NAD(P)H dehydrogenase (quinone)
MAQNILIINGHPDPESYNAALVDAYAKGAASTSASVEVLHLRDLEFSTNLTFGYRQRTELEPDLLAAWEQIKAANHLVWFFPVWWGSVPAQMKGFLDRLFLPGFVFQKREGSLWWDKLLVGKSARVVSTLDQPAWFYRWFNGRPTYHMMKKMVLKFCGVKPVKVTHIGPIRLSKDSYRAKWLQRVEKMGQRDGDK